MDETLDTRFLRAIEAFCEHRGLSGRAFGDAALKDPGFVSSLRRGRSPRVSTLDPVLQFMGDAPLGPAFRGQVQAYLAVTGLKRSVLGERATNNPSFVFQLFGGVSPTLRTVHKVRQWMKANATATQWRRIGRRTPPMPALLSAMPAGRPFAAAARRFGIGNRCGRGSDRGPGGFQVQGRPCGHPRGGGTGGAQAGHDGELPGQGRRTAVLSSGGLGGLRAG